MQAIMYNIHKVFPVIWKSNLMQLRHPKEKRQAIRAPIGKKNASLHYAALEIGVIANFGTKRV